jgi:hypothetical protein
MMREKANMFVTVYPESCMHDAPLHLDGWMKGRINKWINI